MRDKLARTLMRKAPAHGSSTGSMSAIGYFRDCLGLNGEQTQAFRFAEGLKYFNPAGEAKVRGSLNREHVQQIFATPELSGDANRVYRDGIVFACAFGFRTDDIRRIAPEEFAIDYDAEYDPFYRYHGRATKTRGEHVLLTSECVHAWYTDVDRLITHYGSDRNRPLFRINNNGKNVMFPDWKAAVARDKVCKACNRLGFSKNLIWTTHCLRSGAAFTAAENSKDQSEEGRIVAAQRVTGHRSKQMAKSYSRHNLEKEAASLSRLQSLNERREIVNINSPFYVPQPTDEERTRCRGGRHTSHCRSPR